MPRSILLFFLFSYILAACHLPEEKNGASSPDVVAINHIIPEDTACFLSEISYCDHPDSVIEKYLPGWKLVWESQEVNGNHAIIAGREGTFALVIRGSLLDFSWGAFQNWIYQDLHVTNQENWPFTLDNQPATVSSGAYTGWKNMGLMHDKSGNIMLQQILDSLLDHNNSLLITGHSLGGNLATIYASWLHSYRSTNGHHNDDINVITFAAPAAGDNRFAEDFNKKFPEAIRVENELDIVPKFPTEDGFKALGQLYNDSLDASSVKVGYKQAETTLKSVFQGIATVFSLMEFSGKFSPYIQPCGSGKQIRIPLSGKRSDNLLLDWFSEAGYQHSIIQYAEFEKIPILPCAR